jgi:Transposase DDE domain/Protein of unknown function (DUF1698)
MECEVNENWIEKELQGVCLPDKRFQANVISITEHLNDHVGLSFSAACGERLRKSAWRLFSTEELDLLSIHQQRTLDRCAGEQTLLIVEDTTDIFYSQQHKQGMGCLGGSKARTAKGLNMHTALAVSTSGQALGIIDQQIWAPKAGRGSTKRYLFSIEDKETIKWINTLKAVNECWQQQDQQIVLVADREADFFEHYAQPKSDNIKLLVRVHQKKRRVLYDQQNKSITEVLRQLKPWGEGTIKVWRRPGEPQRIAQVEYYSTTVILPPTYKQQLPSQTMQLVCVKEKAQPAQESIEWILLTHLPVHTLRDAVTVCEYYAFRWIMERFHYTLKSGFGIEDLQINTLLRLVNALQLYSLVAWHVLWLHHLGKVHGSKPATDYIEQQTIEIVEAVSSQKVTTVADFLVATAALGGFITTKKQPLPGEKTLWQGLRQLHAIQKGFLAAKQIYGTG